jgi:hypothetical protein
MQVCYLAHPIAAPTQQGVDDNIARAKRWYRWACDSYPDRAFVMNYLVDIEVYAGTDVQIKDEPDHESRQRGLDRDDAVIARCNEFWILCGISAGVERGRKTASRSWLTIVDLTALGDEPPDVRVDLRSRKVTHAE